MYNLSDILVYIFPFLFNTEQVVPSCSPLLSSTNPPQMINTDKKNSESTKQISLFSGDDIFA